MIKSKHILLLEELEANGIEKPFNVSKFMSKYFDKPKMLAPCTWSIEGESALLFLKDLWALEYVLFDYFDLINSIHWSQELEQWDTGMKWFDTVDFYIRPRVKGFELLHQHRLISSNLDMNNRTVDMNNKTVENMKSQVLFAKKTNIILWVTVIVAFLNLLSTVLG